MPITETLKERPGPEEVIKVIILPQSKRQVKRQSTHLQAENASYENTVWPNVRDTHYREMFQRGSYVNPYTAKSTRVL